MVMPDQVSLYTALATVAAITMALQAAAALLLIGQYDDVSRRKKRSSAGESEWNDAQSDAQRHFWTGLPLNGGLAALNGLVLVSWAGAFCSSGLNKQWYLRLPLIAVIFIWLVLLIVVIVFLVLVKINAAKA